MPGGRNIGVLGLDDSIALALGKHLLARYLNAGPAADRPTKGRRMGEAYYAADTHALSVWDGDSWETISGGGGTPGATGPPGPIGIGLDGADGMDGLPVPGPAGAPGAASTVPGPAGATIPGLDGTDGLDAFPIPGLPGLPGVSVMGPPGFDGVDGQEAFPIPGVAGAAGATGAAGVGMLGPPGMDGEDGQDAGLLGLPSSPLLHERYTDAEAIAAVQGEATLDLAGDVTIAAAKSLAVDTIQEKTGNAGVTIEGLLLKDAQLHVGSEGVYGDLTIHGSPTTLHAGGSIELNLADDYDGTFDDYSIYPWDDDLCVQGGNGQVDLKLINDGTFKVIRGPLQVDHINEYTGAHGVDIDGVLCKDDAVETDAIRGLRETTGPTSLAMGAVADGEYLKRVGTTVVGGTPAGGVDIVTVWAYGD